MNPQKSPLGAAGNQNNFRPHTTAKTQHDQKSSLEEIKSALSALTPNVDRDEWVRIGMALKAGLGDEGFQVFDSWSSNGASYNPADTRDVWRSIKPDGGITIKTLFRMARNVGWRGAGNEAERLRPITGARPGKAALPQGDADRHRQAAEMARLILDGADPAADDNPYLVRKSVSSTQTLQEISLSELKRIIGYSPRGKSGPLQGNRILVVPIKADGVLASIEMIDGEGRKSSLAGGRKAGGYWATQVLPEGDLPGLVFAVGEGVATVLSAAQAVPGAIGVATFSNGNLLAVAKNMRRHDPEARIVLLADLDKTTGEPDRLATEAARAIGARLAVPDFGPDRPDGANDFNDLARLHGSEAVKECISKARKVEADPGPSQQAANQEKAPATFSMSDLMAQHFDPVSWTVRDLLPQGVFILAGKPKVGKSWLALHLGLSVAYGQNALGSLWAERGDALYVSMEDHQRRLQNRVSHTTGCRSFPAGHDGASLRSGLDIG
ncbi:MAG: PriCT-2 domain-containing protein, partial [Magnetococcales bacterium]|nr:PriCT-2 domain-containing protein [Magnetococcales bacterium]